MEKPIQTQNSNSAIALATNNRDKLLAILPAGIDVDRYIGIIQSEINKNPDLASCAPATLVGSMVHCARLGLEPGLLNKIYLVPFNNSKKNCKEATVIIGYEGLYDLVLRAGKVSRIDTQPVYKNDEFSVTLGDNPTLLHRPLIFSDRGELIGFYAIAFFKDKTTKFEIMTLDEIDKIASRSKSGYIWKDHRIEMGRKTALRRLCKHLEKSVELSHAVDLENLADTENGQGTDAILIDAGIEYEKPRTVAQDDEFEDMKAKAIAAMATRTDDEIKFIFNNPRETMITLIKTTAAAKKALMMVSAYAAEMA